MIVLVHTRHVHAVSCAGNSHSTSDNCWYSHMMMQLLVRSSASRQPRPGCRLITDTSSSSLSQTSYLLNLTAQVRHDEQFTIQVSAVNFQPALEDVRTMSKRCSCNTPMQSYSVNTCRWPTGHGDPSYIACVLLKRQLSCSWSQTMDRPQPPQTLCNSSTITPSLAHCQEATLH